ncbi:MAG: aminoglycoside 6-adenylyltransferase [Candidatus Promineifilaceae bacterium]
MVNVDSYTNSSTGAHFTEEDRLTILNDLLASLGQDERLVGVLLVGSAADGFDDRYSDIDLSVVVAEDSQVSEVLSDWKTRIAVLFPVLSSFEVNYAENMFLAGFLLTNYLEMDIGFSGFKDLFAKRSRWRVVFDHSGQIEETMQSSWENRVVTGPEAEYRRLLDSIWHYITHVAVSISRGHNWRALHYLETVRTRAIELVCIRRGFDPHHFRPVHHLPPEFQVELQETLPQNTEDSEILRALAKTAAIFFDECHVFDQSIGLDLSSNLRAGMESYLAMFGDLHQKR